MPLQSSSRLQTLISKLNAKFTFIWKEDFGPLSNSPVLFLHSPDKMLLTLFLFQKWLGSPFPEDVWAWWLLIQYSQACGHPCCLCTFSYTNSSFQSTFHLICFDTALCEQPPLSVMTFCDLHVHLYVIFLNIHIGYCLTCEYFDWMCSTSCLILHESILYKYDLENVMVVAYNKLYRGASCLSSVASFFTLWVNYVFW